MKPSKGIRFPRPSAPDFGRASKAKRSVGFVSARHKLEKKERKKMTNSEKEEERERERPRISVRLLV